MRTSLRTFGQRKPVVVNVETGSAVIEAGNHTQAAAKAEGWTHLAVVRVKDDPATETGYALADNRLGELGSYDLRLLVDATRRLKAADPSLLLSAGWNEEEYAGLEVSAARLDGTPVADPSGEWAGMPDFQSDDLTGAYRVMVHFATEEDADRFFELVQVPRPSASAYSPEARQSNGVPFIWWPEHDGHKGLYSKEAWQAAQGEETPT
jgi:hypothetical protein